MDILLVPQPEHERCNVGPLLVVQHGEPDTVDSCTPLRAGEVPGMAKLMLERLRVHSLGK